MWRLFAFSLCLGFALAQAFAFERLNGVFEPNDICEAFQSKTKQTNPGFALVEPGVRYEAIATTPSRDFFQIRVPDAEVTPDRWVSATCGTFTPRPVSGDSAPSREARDHVLALSWQPAFCESFAGQRKPECVALNAGRLVTASLQLSIHGLWPQPRQALYCDVPDRLRRLDEAGQWARLPPLDLSPATRVALSEAMPGVASDLHRHEWIKHGTCHRGGGAEGYYLDTLAVTEAVNESAIGDFLAEHIGDDVEMAELRLMFDRVFGPGAGDAVRFVCARDGRRLLLQEIRIALRGRIVHDDPAGFGALLQDARPQAMGCARAVIDPYGLQ